MPTEGLSEGTLAFDLPKYGAGLKRALDAAGLSYREAEQVIGVDHNTLQRVASGTRPPNVEHYLRIERWLAARAEGPASPGGGVLSPKQAWQDLLDKDDRTSPAEYPEMALITFEELADYMAAAALTKGADHG